MVGAGGVAETALAWESAPRVLTPALLVSGFEIRGKSNGNMEMNPRKKKAGQERSGEVEREGGYKAKGFRLLGGEGALPPLQEHLNTSFGLKVVT